MKSVFDLLRERYDEKSYALFTEVANATGAHASRRADFVVMSLWPSRGLTISGIEKKFDRSDWLRELENPAKAEAVCAYCDYWWILATPDVVKDGELPPTWGLLEIRGDRLVAKVQAPKLEPKPLDRKFLAAILRAAQKATHAECEAELCKAADENFRRGVEHGKSMAPGIGEAVRRFEEAAGVKLEAWDGWHNETLGRLVKLGMNGLTLPTLIERIETAEAELRKTLKVLRG